ncbi:MAG: peptidoglycan-binding protein, partial [Herminiimonas sp.]|nr:peptidoglycan-binding protein [Herminiimonas sp.]
EVLSGKVAVAKPAEGASLTLATAKGAIVDSRTVGPMVGLLPAPRLVARAGADYATAQFAIVPVAGASAYRVQLSTDSDAIDIIAENNAATPQVRLDGIPDGTYFVRISAIDRAGLEGLTRIEPVRISARADLAQRAAAAAPNVDHSNQREIGLKWKPLGGRSFVLQVARDADFSWLVHTVRTAVPQASVPRFGFGTYYARVQSINDDGTPNPFSASQAFIVTDQWVINDGSPLVARDSRSGPAR